MEGRRGQRRLVAFGIEAACFGHGKPFPTGAAGRFRRAFG